MADITNLIKEYLKEHPNAMAKTIASTISKSKSDVNSCLYASKGKLFEVNDSYQWSLRYMGNRPSSIDHQEGKQYVTKKTNQPENKQSTSQRYFIVFEGTHYRFVISDKTPTISERGYAAEIFDIDKSQFILYEFNYKKSGMKSFIQIIPLADNFNEKRINEIYDIPIAAKEKSLGQVTSATTAFFDDYIVVYHYDNDIFFYPQFFFQVFRISDYYYSKNNKPTVTLLSLGKVYSLCVLPSSESVTLGSYNTGTEWTGIMITSETENDFYTMQSILKKHGYNVPKPFPLFSQDKNYLSDRINKESDTIDFFNKNPESPVYGQIFSEKIIHIPEIHCIGLQNKTRNGTKDDHVGNEDFDNVFESNIKSDTTKHNENIHPFYSLSEEHYGNPNFGYNGRENETIDFYISIGNKKRITGTTAAEALINALNEMQNYTTIERMASIPIFVDRMPFISKTHHNIRRASFYPLRNGWWVNTHLSNEAKKRNLEKIAHFCGISIEVHLEMKPI